MSVWSRVLLLKAVRLFMLALTVLITYGWQRPWLSTVVWTGTVVLFGATQMLEEALLTGGRPRPFRWERCIWTCGLSWLAGMTLLAFDLYMLGAL